MERLSVPPVGTIQSVDHSVFTEEAALHSYQVDRGLVTKRPRRWRQTMHTVK
jgi:hypothetical protein